MPRRTQWLGWGFLAGAAAGLVWTLRRIQEVAREGPPGLLDWERVRAVAAHYCRDGGVQGGQEPLYAALVARCVQEVAAYTGEQLPSNALGLRVLDRQQWLETNLHTFRAVLRPLEEIYQRASSAVSPVTIFLGQPIEALLSHQVGMLFGYLAQRVLGQYDVALLGREPLRDGQLYFVDPNIRATQSQLGLSGPDFRMWVVLHETTHAFEFELHPWLRDHFNHLLESYLADLEPEMEHLRKILTPGGLAGLVERARRGEPWLLWALTPRQRDIFDQMQALMCLIEGYSNYVMKQVGCRILSTFDLIEARVAARQAHRTPAQQLLGRLTGLDLKMEQYRLGEHFAEVVARQRGLPFLHRVWRRAENLPTAAEIGRPEQWIARMEETDVPARR